MERGAWWATVHGVTKSQTQLKRLITHARTQSVVPSRASHTCGLCEMQNLRPTELESMFEQVSHVHIEFGEEMASVCAKLGQPPLAQKPQAPYKKCY